LACCSNCSDLSSRSPRASTFWSALSTFSFMLTVTSATCACTPWCQESSREVLL
jgi:hypothetical protein